MALDHISFVLPDTEPQKEGKGRDWHPGTYVSGSVLLTGAAIVLTVLSVGNREVPFANTTVLSQTALAAPSTPVIQSTARAEALVPTANHAPTGDEVDGAVKTARETETQGVAEGPFKEFQIWAAEEDARTQVKLVEAVQPPQPIEDAHAQDRKNARAEVRPSQASRQIETHHSAKKVRTGHTQALVKNARAEIRRMEKHRQARSMQKARPKIQPVHHARLARPIKNRQTEVWPEQNADATWLERTFGWLY